MTSITYIGMDVHTTNFTLCCYSFEDDKVYATVQVKPEYTQILKYIKGNKAKLFPRISARSQGSQQVQLSTMIL